MKLKNIKKLAILGALMSSLACVAKANTITNSVEETSIPNGTVKDITLANNQLLITSDDAHMGDIPVKLFSADTNHIDAAFAAGDTKEILFTNNVSSASYDAQTTNAWYGLEGNHYLLGNMNVSKSALSSVGHRDSATIESEVFTDFPSPHLAVSDGHVWVSFIDPDDKAVCVTKYATNGNTNLEETAYSYLDARLFSKIHSCTTDGTQIWCTTTDEEGKDSITHLEPQPLSSEEVIWGESENVKSSCGIALLGENVYRVSSDQTKLIQSLKDLSSPSEIADFKDKVSAIASDDQNVYAISENGDRIYKVSPESPVQTIVLNRKKRTPIKKIIAHHGTIYGASSNSVIKVRTN